MFGLWDERYAIYQQASPFGAKGNRWDNSKFLKISPVLLTSAVVFERRSLPVDGILFQQVTVRKDTATEG